MESLKLKASNVSYSVDEDLNIDISKTLKLEDGSKCSALLASFNNTKNELLLNKVKLSDCSIVDRHLVSNVDAPTDNSINVHAIDYHFKQFNEGDGIKIDNFFVSKTGIMTINCEYSTDVNGGFNMFHILYT